MMKYNDTEQDAFVRIRATMIDWKDSTIRFASVVAEAKEREIWKVKKYDTFEDFCQIECGITRQWANKLVLANKIMLQIANFEAPKPLQIKETVGNLVSKPTVSITAAIELSKVPESDRQAVVQQATATGQPLTAKAIKEAVAKVVGPETRKDAIGREIPYAILADWDRAYEIGTQLRSVISKVKCTLEKALQSPIEAERDIVFRELSNTIISDASTLHFALSHILPHAVCPKCQGRLNRDCLMCRQRGFVSKSYWEGPNVTRDMRDLILKTVCK